MSDSLRLFLLEDENDVALLISKALERAGHRVTRCRTAADALIVLGHSTFDLLLLDHRLPDMAGLDFLQVLTREGIGTPALMVTAYGDEHLATRVLRAGALDYLVKDPGLAFLIELPKRVNESVIRHRLQQTNRLLIEALESARDGIMITDLQGCILHVNQALERMTGYTRSELLGQNPRLLKSSKHPASVYAEMWHTVLARASWQGELINRRKDGTLLEVSLTISPILDAQGQLTHFVGIQRDMSDQKLLQRQLLQAQKMQSLGTLAGGVAHEFNNLLAGINGYAALALREVELPRQTRDFLQQVVALSERAAGLTRQMLAFARKPSLTRQPLFLRSLLTSTAELVRHTLHIEVHLELDPEPLHGDGLCIEADANQLQQVLVNLALNARDASSEALFIDFRLKQRVLFNEMKSFPETIPAGDFVVVEIADRGCGMTPEVLNQAFDPFFTTKTVGQGTGLGLSVVLGIVHAHQGYLSVESRVGEGTCFSLYFPRLAQEAASAGLEDQLLGSQVLEPEQIAGRRILVLDDEAAVLDVVRRFLEIAGHRVTCVTRESDAVALLNEQSPFDLLILDLLLPGEEGMSTFMRLRQNYPVLPILLCTGLLEPEAMPRIIKENCASILRKPFRMNELWYAVNQALGTDHRA